MPDKRPPGTPSQEQIDRAVRLRHKAAEPSDPPPSWEPTTSQEVRALKMKPWWRRAKDFLVEGHRMAVVFASICAATLAGHAWISGLVTKQDVRTAVEEAVRKAMQESSGRLSDLEMKTGGLPEWRGDTMITLAKLDTRIQNVEKAQANFEQRIDRFMVRR